MRSRAALGKEMFGSGGASAAPAPGAVDAMQLPTVNADAASRKVRRVIVVIGGFRGQKSILPKGLEANEARLHSAEGFGAFGAGADAAEVVVAVDAGGVAVGERDLDRVVADGGSLLRAGFGLEHRQGRGGGGTRAGVCALSYALVIASGAGTFLAKIGEIVVAGVAVGPDDVHAGAAGYVDLYAGGLLSRVDGNGHDSVTADTQQFTVERVGERNGARAEDSYLSGRRGIPLSH